MVKRHYPMTLVYSVLLHIALLFLFIISFDNKTPLPVLQNAEKNTDVISATVMSMPTPTIVPVAKPLPEPKPMPVPTPQPAPKPAVLPKPVVKPEAVAVAKPAVVIPTKKLKPKPDPAKQLLADLKEQTKKSQKKPIVQQKQIDQAFAKQLKAQAMKALQQQLLSENQRVSGLREQQARGIVDKYKALILQAISEHWLLPGNVSKSLYSELMIRLAPGGIVLDVQLTKSSGNEAFDRSARAAVLKASPLPVPDKSAEFAQFKEFVLKVKPENLVDKTSLVS